VNVLHTSPILTASSIANSAASVASIATTSSIDRLQCASSAITTHSLIQGHSSASSIAIQLLYLTKTLTHASLAPLASTSMLVHANHALMLIVLSV